MLSLKEDPETDKPLRSLEEETSHSKSLRETRRHNNSIWMHPARLSCQFQTKASLGISKTVAIQSTCRSGKLVEDGTRCSSSTVIDSSTKEECMLVSRTKRTLLSKSKQAMNGQDGMLSM
jgi:hypothetical protein